MWSDWNSSMWLAWIQSGTVTFCGMVWQIPMKLNEICHMTPLLCVSGNVSPYKDLCMNICNSLIHDCWKHPNCPSGGVCVGAMTWIQLRSITSERCQRLHTVWFHVYGILESQNFRDRNQINGDQELGGEKKGIEDRSSSWASCFASIFSHSVAGLAIFRSVSGRAEIFILVKSNLPIIPSMVCAFCVLCKNSLPSFLQLDSVSWSCVSWPHYIHLLVLVAFL